MKDKIASATLGAIIGGIIVFGYGYFSTSDSIEDKNIDMKQATPNSRGQGGVTRNREGTGTGNTLGSTSTGTNIGSNQRRAFDPSEMNEEQLKAIAQRAGISLKELQSKIESGEDITSIMGEGRATGGRGTAQSGSLNQPESPQESIKKGDSSVVENI